MQALHGSGPVRSVRVKLDSRRDLSSHLILMENDGLSGVYARRKYESHHSHPGFREDLRVLRQCEGMPTDNGEKEFVSGRGGRL